jgi:hypothetical protein
MPQLSNLKMSRAFRKFGVDQAIVANAALIGLAYLSPGCRYLQINQRLRDMRHLRQEGWTLAPREEICRRRSNEYFRQICET